MSIKRPRMAICYDFDGTLAPGNMQEYDYIPRLKITSQNFWEQGCLQLLIIGKIKCLM